LFKIKGKNMKFEIVEVKDDKENVFMTLDDEQRAKDWVENYNINSRRPRNFVIRPVES